MIRGIYRKGVIIPTEPVPAEWADGQAVNVEPAGAADPSDDPDEISRWAAAMRREGRFQFEPGERERFQATLDEANALAKEQVRRDMGL